MSETDRLIEEARDVCEELGLDRDDFDGAIAILKQQAKEIS